MPPKELSPVQRFEAIYEARERLDDRIATASSASVGTFRNARQRAAGIEAELAANPEVREFYTALGRTSLTNAAEIEKIEEEIEEMEGLRVMGLVTEDEVAALRADVDAKSAALDSGIPKIANYFITTYLTDEERAPFLTPTPEEPVAVEPEATTEPEPAPKPGAEAEPEPAPANAETGPKTLNIVVDATGRRISVNGQVISLYRDVGVASRTADEGKIADHRLDMIKFLAEHPGEVFDSRKLWNGFRPGEEFKSNVGTAAGRWGVDYVDFLKEVFVYDGQPIVTVSKPSPAAKRMNFELADYRLSISQSTEEFSADNEGIYMLPNGVTVGGKTGKMLHLLAKASDRKPATFNDAKHIYSTAEVRKLKGDRTSIFSGLITRARRALIDAGITHIEVKSVPYGRKSKNTGKQRLAYYLEIGEEQAPVIAGDIKTEEDVDTLLTIDEATIMAGYMDFYKEVFVAEGIEPLSEELLTNLYASVDTKAKHLSSEEMRDRRSKVVTKVKRLIGNNEALEAMVDALDDRDPRIDLLIHLIDIETNKRWSILDKVVDAQVEQTVLVEQARNKGQGVVGTETTVVYDQTSSPRPAAQTAKRAAPKAKSAKATKATKATKTTKKTRAANVPVAKRRR